MGTSNWQHISYCCDILFALAPRSILDVGIGYGRWGILAREMCDVWRQRVFPEQWQVEIIGVEAFERLVQPYHAVFYNEVLLGDGLAALDGMDRTFDLVILGDVLEHFDRQQAQELLTLARQKAFYTLLCVPLGADWQQKDSYGNPYERHRSRWQHDDFANLGPVCHRFFLDYIGRSYGVYLFASTHLDVRSYWRGRCRDLMVTACPEVLDIYPGGPPPKIAATLRRRLHRYSRLEALARKVYHGLRRLREKASALYHAVVPVRRKGDNSRGQGG
jgi:SAM-dependent methyltransferase